MPGTPRADADRPDRLVVTTCLDCGGVYAVDDVPEVVSLRVPDALAARIEAVSKA